MPEQNDTTNTQSGANTVQTSNQEQVNQTRKVLGGEIKGLRKQVLLMRLQSLKVMQQSVNDFFKQQTLNSKNQVVLQEQAIIKQMDQEVTNEEEVDTTQNTTTKTTNVKKQNKAALRAVQAAQKSVTNALLAANKSIKNAEDILKDVE